MEVSKWPTTLTNTDEVDELGRAGADVDEPTDVQFCMWISLDITAVFARLSGFCGWALCSMEILPDDQTMKVTARCMGAPCVSQPEYRRQFVMPHDSVTIQHPTE